MTLVIQQEPPGGYTFPPMGTGICRASVCGRCGDHGEHGWRVLPFIVSGALIVTPNHRQSTVEHVQTEVVHVRPAYRCTGIQG